MKGAATNGPLWHHPFAMSSDPLAKSLTGGCLCGRVQYRIDGGAAAFGPVANCHCSMCRKAQGSAFGTNADVASANFHLLHGKDCIAEYESSPGKFRCFCRSCGSPLYSRRTERPGIVRVRFGTLNDDPGVRPSFHFAVDSKAPWWDLHDELPRLDSNGRKVS